MRSSGKRLSRRSPQAVLLSGFAVAAASLLLAACGDSAGGGATASGSGATASGGGATASGGGATKTAGSKPTGAGDVKVGKQCGDTVPVGPSNPEGVYSTMSQELKDIYGSYPGELIASPWATKKVTAKPPWKIGYVGFALINAFSKSTIASLKAEFAIAKQQGLVKGDLVTSIPASMAQSTPEGQIAAIQQMVRQGVNAIILLPVDSVSETPAMEAAGKAGVPVILADTPPAPGARYTISPWTQNQVEADAGALGLIKKGNILMVRGVAGNQNDKVLYNQKAADLKNCPDIKVVGTVYGKWDNGTTKNVVSQYLASHPQPLAGVLQNGDMFAGIVEAFEARGAKVPVIGDDQCFGGDLSWWLAHKDSYQTVGGCINGSQAGYVYMNVALRTLANKGPKYNVLSMPAVTIDNTNLAAYAKPGLPLTSDAEVPGPKSAWCDDACLDKYFVNPGPATK